MASIMMSNCISCICKTSLLNIVIYSLRISVSACITEKRCIEVLLVGTLVMNLAMNLQA